MLFRSEGKTIDDYDNDLVIRSAVERQFMIIGEAMAQALQHFPDIEPKFSNAREIISFRNQIVHAYAGLKSSIVWGVIEDDLPHLITEAQALLDELEGGK